MFDLDDLARLDAALARLAEDAANDPAPPEDADA